MRFAVIGVGNLGEHHARIYSQIPDIKLVGVADINQKRADRIAQTYNTKAYYDYHSLIDKVDAVSIVVPTTLHYEIGKEFLSAGKHCLIEKPLTTILQEAEELISIAKQKNLILQVGHIERFNSAIIGVQKYVNNPKFIESDRLGPYDPRVSDVGVVLDLMIHDLDIVLFLVQSKVKELEAYGTSIFSPHEDIVKVRLKFENGCVADISASRVTHGKYRKLRIFQPDAYISIDYTTQRFRIYRKKTPDAKSMQDIEIISPKIERLEPLKQEILHFVDCVRTGKTPLVSGQHGRDALELALEILKRLKRYPEKNE
jgi:predicted dehydrogenase